MRDYHMHTRFCRHAVGGPVEYARAAQEKGIGEICFTPHIPLPGFRPGFCADRLRMDERELDQYLEELDKARALFPDLTIKSGVVAHFDLIKQPGKPVLATNRDDVEEALERCSAGGMSIEINTSGIRKEIAEAYPCDGIVQLMIDREAAIVTGSDAHAPAQVGLGFDQLASRHGAGFACRMVSYRDRKIVQPALSAAGRCR